MQTQKVTLPPPEHKNFLAKLWGHVTFPRPALINRSNFFTGDAVLSDENSIVHSNFQGEVSYTARDNIGWQRIWDTIGHEPPGNLPRKTIAQLHLHALKGKRTSFSIENTLSRENGSEFPTLTWIFEKTAGADQSRHATFAILLKPAAQGKIHTHYKNVPGNTLFR